VPEIKERLAPLGSNEGIGPNRKEVVKSEASLDSLSKTVRRLRLHLDR